MLDFDAGKLLIIGLVALVVIGPKDLPRVLRQVGQAVAKLRRMAGEFQGQFMDAMKEADLQDIKAELAKIKDTATLDVDFNPVRDVSEQMTGALNSAPSSVGGPNVDPAPAMDGGLSGFELPPAAHAASETSVAAGGIGPVADTEPVMTPEAPVHHAETAIASAEPHAATLEPAPSLDQEPNPTHVRRRIVVTRRRRLSRLDGPTIRAAVLAGHSRNIRPARRDTTDP